MYLYVSDVVVYMDLSHLFRCSSFVARPLRDICQALDSNGQGTMQRYAMPFLGMPWLDMPCHVIRGHDIARHGIAYHAMGYGMQWVRPQRCRLGPWQGRVPLC